MHYNGLKRISSSSSSCETCRLFSASLTVNCFAGFQFDIGSQVVGRKDMSKNVLDIWKEVICYILQIPSLSTKNLGVFHFTIFSLMFFSPQVFQRKKTKMERKSHNSMPFEFNSLYSLVSNRQVINYCENHLSLLCSQYLSAH